MAQYAGRAGHRAAVDAASGLTGRPDLVVHSTEQLATTGADVVMHPATGASPEVPLPVQRPAFDHADVA
nr:hypothetical protein GCM10017745_80650 [Saccharothrix mutabilis subsp. capreolus]